MPQSLSRSKAAPLRILLGLLSVAGALTAWTWHSLPSEDYRDYFAFADNSLFLGLPHSMDVLSNLAFAVVSLCGLAWLFKNRPFSSRSQTLLMALFAGSGLAIAAGSIYFHLEPTPGRLFWDRLPLALAFGSLLSLSIGDRIGERLGGWVSVGLIPLAMETVIGWDSGLLTLRPYVMLQYGGLVFLFLLGFLRPTGTIPNKTLLHGLGLYALAKVFELLDEPVFTLTGFLSGHTLKHLFAALAFYKLLSFLRTAKEF